MVNNKPTDNLPDWPDARLYRKSVRREFTIYVAGIILILMMVTGYVVSRIYVSAAEEHVVSKLVSEARAYSGPSSKMFLTAHGPDVLMLNNICKKITADNPGTIWAGFTNPEKKFIAHTDMGHVVSASFRSVGAGVRMPELLRTGEAFEFVEDTALISIPITEQNVHVGNLLIASSTDAISRARATSIRTVALITLTMILIGIPVTAVLVRRKLRPVAVIAQRLRDVNVLSPSFQMPDIGRNEFGYLSATIGALGLRLNAAQEQLVEKERLQRELEIARDIQARILPREIPNPDQCSIAVSYESAKEVGGDYYDFLYLDDDRLGILVADVSGKSLPGMLVMLMTRDIIRSLARRLSDPVSIMTEANRELLPSIRKGTFVTMFLGVLDCRSGHLQFASAGHNPLIVVRENGSIIERIKTKGFPLGMVPDKQFTARLERSELDLSQGDWFVQYTDGFNEGQNESDEEFGMERLIQSIRSHTKSTPDAMVQGMLSEHRHFVGSAPQFDDMTLLVVNWGEQTAAQHVAPSGEVSHAG